ncbi:MAG: cytochrome c3 family protein [Deltaproteobacteria bacterium]|nr:cytochrome c3 family protein [Deltaproteobacteria bacterium]
MGMQVFHRSTNVISRVTIFGGLFAVVGALFLLAAINRSPWATRQGIAREQPVQFSHRHHAGELGIDCRYCHTTVEDLAYAGMPTTQTCMTCHVQIWSDSEFLEPVRASWRDEKPIRWIKVYDLPGYVYFDHSVHVNKGVGCQSCHGDVDDMNVLWQNPSLHMEWCLGCHREPEQHLRPRDQVFSMSYHPPADQLSLGLQLLAEYDVRPRTECGACHR